MRFYINWRIKLNIVISDKVSKLFWLEKDVVAMTGALVTWATVVGDTVVDGITVVGRVVSVTVVVIVLDFFVAPSPPIGPENSGKWGLL